MYYFSIRQVKGQTVRVITEDGSEGSRQMEGNIIMEKGRILSRWHEYNGELYNDDRGNMPEIVAEVESPITQLEVEHALRRMLMKKSPGPDGIATEMLVAVGL